MECADSEITYNLRHLARQVYTSSRLDASLHWSGGRNTYSPAAQHRHLRLEMTTQCVDYELVATM